MNENRYGEALYKVDDCFLVHLKESQEGCRFAVLEPRPGAKSETASFRGQRLRTPP